MPFISSVNSALGGGLWSLVKGLVPTVVTDAVSNFNQSQGTLNSTVSANGALTTVYFDYSTSSDFSSYSSVTAGTTSSQNASVSSVLTGISNGTLYYVRCRAVNSIGTTIGSSVSFTTWSLKTYTKTTSGVFSVEIPSIPGVAPTVLEMILYGGGGGANYGGGGGGGYRLFSSHTSSVTGTQNIAGVVGAGGAGGNGGIGVGTAGGGGSTGLTIGSTSWTGNGGTPGNHPGTNGAPSGRGGTSGSGDNTAKQGGTNAYGYYYVSGYNQGISGYDKGGNPIYYTDYNSPIYSWDANYYACGGGGGTDSEGGNATGHTTNNQQGGKGGNGGGAYGLRGGNGGGGYGTQGINIAGDLPAGSGPIVGTGGTSFAPGSAGGITFKYYGP